MRSPGKTAVAALDFWATENHGERPALIDEQDQPVSHAALAMAADDAVADLPPRCVFALLCSPTRATVQVYLGALRQGHVPLLLDGAGPAEARETLLAHYGITACFDGAPGSSGGWSHRPGAGPSAHPDLGLLLSTWWLAEPLDADLLAGAALILGGVACAIWPRRRR